MSEKDPKVGELSGVATVRKTGMCEDCPSAKVPVVKVHNDSFFVPMESMAALLIATVLAKFPRESEHVGAATIEMKFDENNPEASGYIVSFRPWDEEDFELMAKHMGGGRA